MKRPTKFGRLVRMKRMERGFLLLEMADYIGVSASMLSMAEMGKKKVPTYWLPLISDFLRLNDDERQKMERYAQESRDSEDDISRDELALQRCLREEAGYGSSKKILS